MASMTGGEDTEPRRLRPEAEIELPTLLRLRIGIEGPKLPSSKAKSAGSGHARLRGNKVRPSRPALRTKAELPTHARPQVSTAKSR